jgi:hypothetical protein
VLLVLVLVTADVLVGLVAGRWWALAAAAALGAWIARSTDVEAVPGWFFGLVYAGFAALGIAAGVLGRRSLARRH